MWIKYGYFVRLSNGVPVPAGSDFGTMEDSYKPGDSKGIKNGKEGIVIAVVKGHTAKETGCDVLVLLEERDLGQNLASGPSPEAIESTLRALTFNPLRTSNPRAIQTPWKEQNTRAIALWNRVYLRPITETFHEFLVEVPLKGTFGEKWYKQEILKPENERHAVVQWLRSFREEGLKHRPQKQMPGRVYGAPATGATTELIALSHDLYTLLRVNHLPDQLVARLRNYNEFQGARYEVAIAAAFVKCGFELEWIESRREPHPEFIARNKNTGENLAVETKSRRRPGSLHQPGDLPPERACGRI
ncbi:hypothetical protein H7849_16285 [Alloacidobacterium dinghuense]|uniref:Uncharacterized protein n=1 Tax=Alloacidobacterium dinghuense TaxID=2763107 RepID=A0A7G8BDR2_9BACT|nr:hypothetical protein [Alloacidobacterium dinghuense]QNI30682.1 hypothetical protein H7849_16285 [Alloacidobacterium dinghuense]